MSCPIEIDAKRPMSMSDRRQDAGTSRTLLPRLRYCFLEKSSERRVSNPRPLAPQVKGNGFRSVSVSLSHEVPIAGTRLVQRDIAGLHVFLAPGELDEHSFARKAGVHRFHPKLLPRLFAGSIQYV